MVKVLIYPFAVVFRLCLVLIYLLFATIVLVVSCFVSNNKTRCVFLHNLLFEPSLRGLMESVDEINTKEHNNS